MLNAQQITGFALQAADGRLGHVQDIYFDDIFWCVRYLDIDTGGLLPDRRVLVSPQSVIDIQPDQRRVLVSLTVQQVRESPGIETHMTVSRQHEMDLARYYNWMPYWTGTGIPLAPGILTPTEGASEPPQPPQDPNLRSTEAVTGYDVLAADGKAGHVEDFLIDPDRMRVCYLVVDTRNWWPGGHVLMAPRWVQGIDWAQRRLEVALTSDLLKGAPEYKPGQMVDRPYEKRLHDYYRRRYYWEPDGAGDGQG